MYGGDQGCDVVIRSTLLPSETELWNPIREASEKTVGELLNVKTYYSDGEINQVVHGECDRDMKKDSPANPDSCQSFAGEQERCCQFER